MLAVGALREPNFVSAPSNTPISVTLQGLSAFALFVAAIYGWWIKQSLINA